ncbi:MAG: Uma2 family endonuclease [Bacteroidota bacterium]|nr:Uma2 family endonuclease [Bacteroidota bacterium]
MSKELQMVMLIERDYPLPLYLTPKGEMTKEEFYEFCIANSHLRIERDEHNQIWIMAPVGGDTGNKHIEIVFAIEQWNKQKKLGKTFDSSTGFELPDRSMRSPDVSWITNEKWNSLSEEEKDRFLPFAPDFAVEVFSPTDKMPAAQSKMHKWIQNGTRLAWLIVPKQQLAFIYRMDGTVDKIEGFKKKLSGENVLPGLEFDLTVLL